ncbi:hypothetical protein BBta_1490 [Bradyrhizobium sp. BTAi1]|jgi:hypothetical protein|nr:hypothetical protein BBta_1490 [Bradyrhizobium sp. BTAi1]
MPGGKRTAASVALVCLPHIDAIDSDRQAYSADGLSRKRQHALEHGDPGREIAIEVKECGKKLRRLYCNEVSNGYLCRRLNAIKADRNAV